MALRMALAAPQMPGCRGGAFVKKDDVQHRSIRFTGMWYQGQVAVDPPPALVWRKPNALPRLGSPAYGREHLLPRQSDADRTIQCQGRHRRCDRSVGFHRGTDMTFGAVDGQA